MLLPLLTMWPTGSQIRALLQKYGAAKLSGVDPANYKALLKDVEGLDHA